MAKIIFLPQQRSVEVNKGITLLQAARKARVSIRSRCDGHASCLMCKVELPAGQVGVNPPTMQEKVKLGEDSPWRLACQARVFGEVTVLVPEDPLKMAVREQLRKLKEDQGEH